MDLYRGVVVYFMSGGPGLRWTFMVFYVVDLLGAYLPAGNLE